MRIYIISVLLFFAIYVTGIDSFGQMKVKILEPPSEVSSITDEILTTKLTKEKIILHINSLLSNHMPMRNKVINQVVDNMQFDKMYIERSSPLSKVIIIPLKSQYFSQNIDYTKQLPFQYLLISEKENNNFSRIDLAFIYPIDKQLKEMPKNAFHDFYYDLNTQIDCIFKLVNFNDVIQGEMYVEKGKRVKITIWESKICPNVKYNDNCKEWFLITDLLSYEGEGSIKTTKQLLGKSYTECPPGYTCDVR